MNREIEIPKGYEARIEGNKVIIELTESEDERIRMEIIGLVKFALKEGSAVNPGSDVTREQALAWLEKQKEQKEINLVKILKHYPKETELYSPLYGKLWLAEVDETNEIITCYKHPLEKDAVRTILEQEDTISFYSDGTTGLPDFEVSKDCMLFLYNNNKEQKPKNILTDDDSLQTAYLKGQTDILKDPKAYGLQKEQKPAECLKPERDCWYVCIKDFYAGGKKQSSNGDLVQAKGGMYMMGREDISEWFRKAYYDEIKPAEWSEEDEKMMQDIIQFIETGWTDNGKSHLIPWLKSLHERFNFQPEQEWSEEDEEMLGKLQRLIILCREDLKYITPREFDNLDSWLKSLRPQPHKWYIKKGHWYMCIVDKPEYGWTKGKVYQSPEDNRIETNYKGSLTNWPDIEPWFRPATHSEILDNQSHWKPSEDQMKHLYYASTECSQDSSKAKHLSSLYESLKKL